MKFVAFFTQATQVLREECKWSSFHDISFSDDNKGPRGITVEFG